MLIVLSQRLIKEWGEYILRNSEAIIFWDENADRADIISDCSIYVSDHEFLCIRIVWILRNRYAAWQLVADSSAEFSDGIVLAVVLCRSICKIRFS